jgi:1,4-alpha-glucan branching enzyme
MAITKKFLKTKPICKCTFKLPKEAAPDASVVTLAGDFNDWKTEELPLKKLKSGDFKIELDLPVGNKYEYRYLVDDSKWINDWDADEYVHNTDLNVDNSVVCV